MEVNQEEDVNDQDPQVPEDDDEDGGLDHDEDEEDDEDDDEPMDEDDDEDDDPGNVEEDTVEGGIADADDSRSLSSEADIVLYLLCAEQLKDHDDHPILKPGVKVRIGLGKNTRLSAVMQRYVEVCNQVRVDGNQQISPAQIELSDLEFFHASVLKGGDTAEQGALMKDDVVRVRRNRWEHHEKEKEANKKQRESDVQFLEKMRNCVDSPANATVVLDCKGRKLRNTRGVFSRNQHPTKVFCDAALVSKRCPWLGKIISAAISGERRPRLETERTKAVIADGLPKPVMDGDEPSAARAQGGEPKPDGGVARVAGVQDEDDFDDDHAIQVLNYPRPENRGNVQQYEDTAAQIENDDDDSGVGAEEEEEDVESRLLSVEIPDHPAEALRLLLEYCYTNRVLQLGQEAFRLAARTKPVHREQKGNLNPYGTKRWPNRGEPTISFELAAGAIRLAEEASMPRFSLMCEIAASHLVTPANVVEALTLCKRSQDQHGNQLQRLRRAAMDVVFHSKAAFGTYENIYMQPGFKDAVEQRAPLLVPALFNGTADSVEESLGKKKYYNYRQRDWKASLYERFQKNDDDDRRSRARERAKYRSIGDGLEDEHPLIVDELDALTNDVASRKTMKRLRSHSSRSSSSRKRERRGSH